MHRRWPAAPLVQKENEGRCTAVRQSSDTTETAFECCHCVLQRRPGRQTVSDVCRRALVCWEAEAERGGAVVEQSQARLSVSAQLQTLLNKASILSDLTLICSSGWIAKHTFEHSFHLREVKMYLQKVKFANGHFLCCFQADFRIFYFFGVGNAQKTGGEKGVFSLVLRERHPEFLLSRNLFSSSFS